MSKQAREVLGTFILLVVAALACTCNLPFLPGTETPPPPSSRSDVLFQDDFSDPDSRWEVGDYDTGGVGYKGGATS